MIIGDIDVSNSGRVYDFATRFLLAGNALILDLSGVDFFSARGVSVLIARRPGTALASTSPATKHSAPQREATGVDHE